MPVRLATLLGCALLTTIASAHAHDHANANDETRQLKLQDRSELQATVRTPPGPWSRLPAVLVFGGFENAAKVLDLVKPDRPVVLATFDYPFKPDRRWEFPASLKLAPEVKSMVHRTREGIPLLVRTLASDPRVDPKRIYVIGASFGSPFAVTAAADEKTIAGVAIVHGFGDIPLVARSRLGSLWREDWGGELAARLLSGAFWKYLAFPSPEDSARQMYPHQRVLMITAEQDSLIPRPASDSLWGALDASPASSKKRVLVSGDHLMPGSVEKIADLLGRVDRWMFGPRADQEAALKPDG